MSALNISGNNSKTVAKEVFNSMYELTKDGPNPKTISEADKEILFKKDPNDITRTYLAEMFADLIDSDKKRNATNKSKYNTWDKITIPANHFYPKQPTINTTIGRYIFNKFIFQGAGIITATTFLDGVVNKGMLGDIDNLIGDLYMKDIINRDMFNQYLDRRDCLGYWLNGMIAHTISPNMAKPLKSVMKKKEELCKKYEKELADGDIDVMTKISDELIAFAKQELKGDPGMDLYDSGDLDFGNNYKNNSILKGAVKNQLTGGFDFVSTSFMDGIDIKDIPAHANSILASQYPASIATADSGYMGKKLLALLQMSELDEDGTDCGTKKLIPTKITKTNKSSMLYTWIDDGNGKLIMLTKDNINKYIGKYVKMRSPMTCTNQKICSKCAGKLFYMLGVKHAGLYAVQISHSALNLGLKAKHDSVVSLFTIDPDNIIEDI